MHDGFKTAAIWMGMALAAAQAGAATINVNTFATGEDLGDGRCSLAEAFVALENRAAYGGCPGANGSADKIQLQSGTYMVDRELWFRSSVEIIGAGMDLTRLIATESAFILLNGLAVVGSINATVRDLNLQGNGDMFRTGFISDGTDNRFTCTIRLLRVRVMDFSTSGIKNLGANLTIDHCMISGNYNSDEAGGGIQNWGMTLNGGRMTITRSVVAENYSTYGGGGIANFGSLSVDNSTISNNVTEGDQFSDGGGILVSESNKSDPYGHGESSLKLVHVTLGVNFASSQGGGVFIDPAFPAISTSTSNSIFFDNGRLDANFNWIASDFDGRSGSNKTGNGPNLFRTTATTLETKTADLRNVDPQADPLDNNGGLFPTHALRKGGPAIDKATGTPPASDQRDLARPIDGDANGTKTADLGAFEFDANTQVEILPLMAKSSDVYGTVTSSSYQNGKAGKLTSNATNDFFTVGVPVPGPGTYAISVRGHKGSDRGRFQLAVQDDNTGAWVNVGTSKDLYASSSSMSTISVGSKGFAFQGLKNFRFTVAGKNSSSSNYRLYFDYIKLVKQ